MPYTSAYAEVEVFSIDDAHSFANWEVRHGVARTSGTFHDIKGTILFDSANIAQSSVNATISVFSLNSSHLRRDVHVLTDEFLDARNYPDIKFVSSAIVPVSAEKGALMGQLTLRGVTRPVSLDYQILGFGLDPWGGMRAGFKATLRLKRSDFGMTKFLSNGLVGNEIDLTLLIEGIKLAADGQPWNAKAAAAEKNRVISYPMPTQPELQAVVQTESKTESAGGGLPVGLPVIAPAVPGLQPVAPALQPVEKLEGTKEEQVKKKIKGLLK
jgi:polyisoprenoid-binding protein YceI